MKNFSLNHTDYDNAAAAVQLTVLPNGITIATAKRPIHSVVVSVFAHVGARFETEAENGLSHFLEHMAFKGTTTRSTKDIAVQIERLGADINAFTSRNMTAYIVSGLPDHISPALDILSDVLRNSVLDPEEIAREQNVVVQEIHESKDDIQDIAMTALSAAAYPDQPLGRPILGPEENVRGFDQATIRAYMDRYYHAGSMIVFAAGNVDHDSFVAEATARFGDMEPTLGNAAPATASYVGGTAVVADERYDQAHLFVALPAPGMKSDDFARFDLLSDVLGSGMSSPLFQEVREKRALCYSVGAGMSSQYDHSLFVIQGSTTAENVDEFLTTACGELVRIANGTIEDNDWERARNSIVRQIVGRADNAMRSAQNAASDLFSLGRVRSMDETVAIYMAVTREQVVAAAKELLTLKPTIVVAGNAVEADYEALVVEALTA